MTNLKRLATTFVVAVLASVVPTAPLPKPDVASRIRTWSLRASTGPITAPDSFSLLGVSWPSGERPPAGVEVRTKPNGGEWTEWTELEYLDEEGPDLSSPENRKRSTTPLWVGDAHQAQIRWIGSHQPRGARLELVDPGPDPVRSPGSAASAATSQPGITTRAGWGADESLRRGGPRYATELDAAFVHHTATSNSYSASESDDIVRSIYAYHTQSNGWDDIGYNFLVDRYGRIFEGRAGGIDRAVIGAHARGFNTETTGVALIGTFSGARPPQAAYDGLQSLLAWKLDLHHVDPTATTQMTSGGSDRYPEGQQVTIRTISGHRDIGHTDCPGGALYDTLPSVRDTTMRIGLPKIYDPVAAPTTITPDGDGNKDSATFTARLSGNLSWTASIRSDTGQTVRSFSGSGSSVRVVWDGRNGSGQVVPYGRFVLHLDARDVNPARPANVSISVWRHERPIVDADGARGAPGYWMSADDGAILAAGASRSYGSMAGRPLVSPVVGMDALSTDDGYWMVASDGGVFSFGNARFRGSMGGKPLVKPVVGMAAKPNAQAYWLVASDGGVFTFGEARFHGSMGGKPLVAAVNGMEASPSGNGYWLVASDGGIFTFGDARFRGSMGGKPLVRPVVGMARTPSGAGYWMVASDGGIFSFGDARFHGSMGGKSLPSPIVGMAVTSTGGGYWLFGRAGNVYAFGDAEGSGVLPPIG